MSDLSTRFVATPDIHQTMVYADFMRLLNWEVSGGPGSQIFYRKLGPLTIAKLQRPTSFDPSLLSNFRKARHTFITYLEPGLNQSAIKLPWSLKVEPFAHSCTSLIDLLPGKKEILNSFSQKTRYNITRNLKKNYVSIRSIPLSKLTKSQLDELFLLHDIWSKKKHVIGYPRHHLKAIFTAFKKTGVFHLAYQDKLLIGALLILYHDTIATYYAAFASPLGYSTFAPTLLTWTAIQSAKEQGSEIFDFGGIYDPRYHKMYKNWQGFTKFKSGFNPTVISYPETTLQIGW